MSESMVGQVAKAIESGIADLDLRGAGPLNYDNIARAAIAAMRNPTDGMLDYCDAGVKRRDALLVWQHQIDEALK